uniref:Vitellogenin domain-containing protein n=1 Tax=Parascaris equorum TaxID=6256 RepID=A0A914S4H0_PAREQ
NGDGCRTQRIYRYLHKGQISNGLSKLSTQNAAARIEAQVALMFPNNQRTALFHLEKIRVGSINGDLPVPSEVKRFEIFEEKDIEEENFKLLSLPLRFKYVDGLVSEIEFDRDDESWSENIKRALLDLLQVNLKKNRRTDIQGERRLSEHIDILEKRYDRASAVDFFTAQEELLFTGIIGSIVFNYKIIGNRNRFLIKDAEVESQYLFAPLGETHVAMKSVVVGRLELLKITKDRTRWEEPRSENKQSLIDGSCCALGIESEVTHQMTRLTGLLGMCSMQELLKIVNGLCQRGHFDDRTEKKVCDILVDALAVAGTKNTIEVLVEKIEQRRISTLKAAVAMKSLVNVKVVSEKQIDLIFRLCKKDLCEGDLLLKQSCFLTVSGMINALCKENNDHLAIELTNENPLPATNFIPQMQKQNSYSTTYCDCYRSLWRCSAAQKHALKTLANVGIDLSVYELEKIIANRKHEEISRVQAIDALRQLRNVMLRKIQQLLMPIFKDKSQRPEIRITALTQTIHTLPQRTVLDQIAETLLHEQSHQVHSFTYSIMKIFASSENPCQKALSKIGFSLDLASTFTKDGVLPRQFMVNFDTIADEQWKKSNLQFGFYQYSAE